MAVYQTTFRIEAPGEVVWAVLTEARERGRRLAVRGRPRVPFALKRRAEELASGA